MKIKFSIDNFLLQQAGKILMLTGILGIIFDVRYDMLVSRARDNYVFGPMQWIALGYCIFLIYVGYIFDDFTKEMR